MKKKEHTIHPFQSVPCKAEAESLQRPIEDIGSVTPSSILVKDFYVIGSLKSVDINNIKQG